MQVALDALRELRALGGRRSGNADFDTFNEFAGLLSGALLGSALWILLLRLTWFS